MPHCFEVVLDNFSDDGHLDLAVFARILVVHAVYLYDWDDLTNCIHIVV